MRFELFIAARYLLSRRKQAFISFISLMSVIGVALGVGALVVVMGVYNGFTADIRDKIIGSNAHVLVMNRDISALDAHDGQGGYVDAEALLKDIPGVRHACPYLYTEVMISTAYGATGIIIRGIDPAEAGEAMPMLSDLHEGSVAGLKSGSAVQGIVIGRQLAERYRLGIGSRVSLMSPAGQTTSAGFMPKIQSFKVAGIFNAGMSDYDNRLAYLSLESAQKLMGVPEGRVSGIELYLDDPYAAAETAGIAESMLGAGWYARNWMDMNAGLFAALELERIGMFIILAMIVLVSSFSIITSLVMLVMDKRRDIAVLMSMGATGGCIRRIFMLQGTLIGAAGTLAGYAGGLFLAWLLKKYQFIHLPPGVYTLDHLPVLISVPDTLFIGFASMLMCFLATIYPSRKAAGLQPAEALRYE